MTRKQCEKCPWKKSTNPRDIPNGYCERAHAALSNTIAEPGSLASAGAPLLPLMACHDSPLGQEVPCVGWLVHQLGEGNNLGLRWAVIQGRVDADVETVGAQHKSFEETLPRKAKNGKKQQPR